MIQEFSDFLPIELAEGLYSHGLDVISGAKAPRGIWTNLMWDTSLSEQSGLVLCIRPPESIEEEIESLLIRCGVLNLETDERITKTGTSINVWGHGSFIPSHSDGNYSKAVTVYLNKDWKYNDGGIFHWQSIETKDWYSVTPSFNRAVVNGEGIPHGISPVHTKCRITLQIFIHKLT